MNKLGCFLCIILALSVNVWADNASDDKRMPVCPGFRPAEKIDPKLPRVLLVGDSICSGYSKYVIKKLEGKANVDAWVTGINLKRPNIAELQKAIAEQGPYDVIHFNIGLHGMGNRILPDQYELLLRKYVANWKKSAPDSKLIWASTTPMRIKGKTEFDPDNNPQIIRRNTIADEVMKEVGITVNDLYGLSVDHLDLGAKDGIHWKKKAHPLMADQIIASIVNALESGKKESNVPMVSLTASQTTGNPGDKIIFTWKVDDNGNSIQRTTLRIDGEPVNWTSPHTWTAIPGTHVFHIQVRWGKDPSGKDKPFVLDYAKVEISGGEGNFIHPGIYNSQEELDVIKAKVNGSADHPMKQGWKAMLSARSDSATGRVSYSDLSWKPHPVAIVYPKTSNKLEMRDDAIAAYAHALQWVVTGKQAHADKAIEILNVWSYTFTDMVTQNGDVYKNLFTSWTANNWAAAAEIIRHYNNGAAGWTAKDVDKFEDMCRVLERLSLEWVGYIGGYGGNQNQGSSTARTRMALGVFLDDQALFDSGVRILYGMKFDNSGVRKRHGHAVNFAGLTVASDGEIMEFNRDAAHGMGSFNLLVNAAEILRHQNVDPEYNLYDLKLDNDTIPRLLKGSEFAANSYLNSPTPITSEKKFINKIRGRNSELILNYYKYLSPESYPCSLTEKLNAVLRPMQADGGYVLPWTTLTHADLSAGKKRLPAAIKKTKDLDK